MNFLPRIILALLITVATSLVVASTSAAAGPGSGTGSDQYVETIPDAKGPKESPGEKGPKNDDVRAAAQIGAGGLEDFAAATAPAVAPAEARRGGAGNRGGVNRSQDRSGKRSGPISSGAISAAAVADQGGVGPLGLIGAVMLGSALVSIAAARIFRA